MTTLYDQIQEHGRLRPNQTALWQLRADGEYATTSYGVLAASAERFAHAFAVSASGTAIVPMYLGKSVECIAAMIGALGVGKGFSCLNRKLRLPQIAGILRDTRASIALVDGPGLLTLKAGLGDPAVTQPVWWLVRDR